MNTQMIRPLPQILMLMQPVSSERQQRSLANYTSHYKRTVKKCACCKTRGQEGQQLLVTVTHQLVKAHLLDNFLKRYFFFMACNLFTSCNQSPTHTYYVSGANLTIRLHHSLHFYHPLGYKRPSMPVRYIVTSKLHRGDI